MEHNPACFSPPASRLLRWLIDPGRHVPADIQPKLLKELYNTPRAVLMGISNGLIVNIFALSQHGGNVFLGLLTVDIVVSVIRFQIAHRAAESTARGLPWATDTYLRVAFAWCALQGAMAFFAMISEIAPVQFLSGISVMGLVGPLCARNFAAPRWALLLSATLVLPMVIGGLATGRSWALILVLQLPIFLVGCSIVIRRFQGLAVATLLAQAKSHRDATHDALTGLMNRHGLIGALSQAPWSKADWDAQTGYVAFYLDLDGFKGVNDRLGHHAGDQLLVEIASRLRSCCKPDDILGRIGGDEFVIVRRWATPREAHVFADRMIRRIAHQPYHLGNDMPRVSIGLTIGYACAPEDAVTVEDLLRQADTALNAAKQAGKGIARRYADHPHIDLSAMSWLAPIASRSA